jgi:hypothetical protein
MVLFIQIAKEVKEKSDPDEIELLLGEIKDIFNELARGVGVERREYSLVDRLLQGCVWATASEELLYAIGLRGKLYDVKGRFRPTELHPEGYFPSPDSLAQYEQPVTRTPTLVAVSDPSISLPEEDE